MAPPTWVGGREGGFGGGGVRPFLFSTENSQIVAYSLGMQIRSEFNLNSPNSLGIRSQREFAANSA